jgi:hypothetical protein
VKKIATIAIALADIFIILVAGLVGISLFFENGKTKAPDVFIGVDIGYGDENDVYKVTDAVKGYANLIILGSLTVTTDDAALTRVCDYLSQEGFYFIIYIGFGNTTDFLPPRGPSHEFFNTTADRWRDKFLGVYLYDEVGGKQLDALEKPVLKAQIPPYKIDAKDYTYVAASYYANVIGYASISVEYYSPPFPALYTSDYGLFWFDYLSGYNNVFTEFVGNYSRQIAIALCRGAAHTMNQNIAHTTGQNWGAIITWKYDQPPFLEDAQELYNDMKLAYENQAKYIMVFDSPYPKNNTTPLGILTEDHINAIKQFWNYTKTNPRNNTYPAETAYVIPSDYGYGMRGANDTIWGLWPADSLSPQIWNNVTSLISTYGSKIDIVYETKIDSEKVNLPYNNLIFWNGTKIQE